MADYTKVNFMDIKPGSDNPDAQLRFSRSSIDSKDLGLSYLKYAPGFQSQMAHSHKVQEEVYVVIKGSGRVLLDGETQDLKQWDVLRVAPKTVRAFAAGPDGLEMIIAGGPKPPEGDGVRADANWPNQ